MAAENNIQGKVLVSFTVEKDGSLTDLKVERKLGYGTDEEAMRVWYVDGSNAEPACQFTFVDQVGVWPAGVL